MDVLSIIRIAFLAIIGLFVVICLLVGLKRGLTKSVHRLIWLVISVLLAVLASNIALNIASETVTDFAMEQLAGSGAMEQIGELFVASPTLEHYLPTLALHLVAPILFLVFFIIFAILTAIIGAIINIFLKKLKAMEKGPLPRLGGMFVSAIGGLLIAVSLLTPFAGYMVTVSNVYAKVEEIGVMGEDGLDEETSTLLTGIKDDGAIKFVYTLSTPMFKGVTSYTNADGRKSNVVDDLNAILDFVPAVMGIAELNFNDIENLDLTPFKNIVNKIGDNVQMRAIVAEILSYATTKWYNGEEFMGISVKAQLPEDLDFILDPILVKLKDTTKTTVKADLNSFITEIDTLKTVYPAVMEISEMNFSDLKSLDTTPFTTIAETIGDTAIVKEIVVSVMQRAGGNWLDAKAFMNINIEETLPEDLKGCLTPAYEVLAYCSDNTIVEDLEKFISVLDAFKYISGDLDALTNLDFNGTDAISNMDTTCLHDLVEHTSSSELVSEILANVLSKAGTKWASGQTFMDVNFEESLPEDMQGALTPAFELVATSTKDNLKANLTAFANLFDDMKAVYAKLDGFKDVNLNPDNLDSFDTSAIKGIATAIDEAKSPLTAEVVAIIIAKAGTNWENSMPFMGMNIEETLPEDLKGTLTSAFTYLASSTKDNVSEHIEQFALLFDDMKDVIADVDGMTEQQFGADALDSVNVSFIRKIAATTENASSCLTADIVAAIVGKAGSAWLVPSEFMGLNIKAQLPENYKNNLDSSLNALANTTGETVCEDLNDFADSINVLVNTYKYMQERNDDEVTQEELSETLSDSLSTVTEHNKDMVADMVDSALNDENINNGLPTDEDSLDAIGSIIKGALDNIAKQNQEQAENNKTSGSNEMSEATKNDAKAINNIIDFASSGSDITEEKADGLIDSVLSSNAISQSIKDYTDGEDSSSIAINETQKSAIADAIEKKSESENLTDAEKDTLEALKKLFGI